MNKYKHEKTIDNIKDLKNFISELKLLFTKTQPM